jgi:hypothetical protein
VLRKARPCVIHKEGLCTNSGDINGLMNLNYTTPDRLFKAYLERLKQLAMFDKIGKVISGKPIHKKQSKNKNHSVSFIHTTHALCPKG